MSKLRDQLSINDRLRAYIERMLSVIMENSPQLLEVTTSSGISIGSMGMTSTNNKSLLPPTIITTNSSSTVVKNPSADKYCSL